MREVDAGQPLPEQPLLAVWISVVRGDAGIPALTGDCAPSTQQRTGWHGGRFVVHLGDKAAGAPKIPVRVAMAVAELAHPLTVATYTRRMSDRYADEPSDGPEYADQDARPRRRGRRILRVTLVGVLTLALLSIATVAGYLTFLNYQVSTNVTHERLLPEPGTPIVIDYDFDYDGGENGDVDASGGGGGDGDGGNGDGNASGGGGANGNGDGGNGDGDDGNGNDGNGNGNDGNDGSPATPTAPVIASPPPRSPDAGDALNFLVIGSDSRDPSSDRGRSDVMVLMHVSDDRESVHLVHFPRDLFVDIPGFGQRNKLNAAYAYGGAPLLVETVQPLIGVPIDHVAIVDFQSFQAMTDAVGGVDVNVDEASPGFVPGVMRMDGETGLRFVRERYALSQGDISRGERQLEFIKAIMLKSLSRETLTNPSRLSGFVDAATRNLTVDDGLEVGEMRDLAFGMRGVRGEDIQFVTAPWSGIGSDDLAGSIVLMNEGQMGVLAGHLQTDSMDDYVDTVSPQVGFGR